MEDHYRLARRRLDVLMDGDEPVGGRWNFDADNRQPPPKSLRADRGRRDRGAGAVVADEDEIDDEVRARPGPLGAGR